MNNGKTQLAAIILAAVIAFVFGLGGGVAGMYMVNQGIIALPSAAEGNTDMEMGTSAESEKTGSVTINVSENFTVAEAIAEKVLPSVVGISTTYQQTGSYGGFFGFGWGNNYSYDATGVGTGVIIDSAGYILTNSHVINDGSYSSINVSLYNGEDAQGTVLWCDSNLDLAIVKIEAKGLVAAELGDSSQLKIGSYAAAIGNPLGLDYERSMSQGIISGLDRTISVSNDNGSSTTMEGLLQTDATINSGNSGGPLLNSKGEVVGINTAKASSGEGMGFAIPINVAKTIVKQIKSAGSYERPYIGISGLSLEEQNSYSAAQLMEYFGTSKGIYVRSITAGGGAEAAGVQKEDIIIAINDIEVGTMNKLNQLLVGYEIGDEVELTIMRDKAEIKLTVKLTGDITQKIDLSGEVPSRK